MGHGLKDDIVKLDRAWDKDGRMRSLRRHGGLFLCVVVGGGGGDVVVVVLRMVSDVGRVEVRLMRNGPLGRERGVQGGERQALVKVPGDQA